MAVQEATGKPAVFCLPFDGERHGGFGQADGENFIPEIRGFIPQLSPSAIVSPLADVFCGDGIFPREVAGFPTSNVSIADSNPVGP